MSASAGTMKASTARSDPALPLWSTSACAALLVHIALAALLFLSWNRRLPLPAAPRGTPNALDVEFAPASAPAPRASTVSSGPPPIPSPLQFKALPQMATLASAAPPPPIPPATAPSAAQTSSPLTSIAPLGQPDASADSPNSDWLAQVEAQLERYKKYPPSALRRGQQDTVRLQFSVDRAGRVTTFHIDSALHYRALEQEVRHMLQLAAPFPAPPAYIAVDDTVIHQDVNFSILPARPVVSTRLCPRPAGPGQAPAGDSATLEQMHTYQDHLQQYVAATRRYLDCMSLAHATPAGNAAIAQLNTLIAGFNTQTQAFKQAADLRALKAQQAQQQAAARFAQARSSAQQAYAACPAPSSGTAPPITKLTPRTLPAYRKRLVAYDAAVHAYVTCIDQARQAVLAQSGDGLTGTQRAELDVDAARIGNVAVDPLNQLVAAFNTQLHAMQKESRAAQAQLAAVFARERALFPNSSWSVPAPLPTDECLRIARMGQGYVAQLCRSTYVSKVTGSTSAAPGAARAARSGDTFVIQTPAALAEQAGGDSYQTISYSVSEFQVAGTHVSLTISQQPVAGAPASAPGTDAIHFDLVLSPDRQTLRGRCSTQQRRWDCRLSRHP